MWLWIGIAFAGTLGAPPPGRFVQLSLGNGHACAVLEDHTLACWSNPDALFALGEVPAGSFREVHVGMSATCAWRTSGEVVCFAASDVNRATAPTGPIAELCHDDDPCARRSDDTAFCVDRNGAITELGAIQPGSLACGSGWSCGLDPAGDVRCVPIDTVVAHGSEAMPSSEWEVPKGPFVAVASGYQHGCALRPDKTAVCWGRDVDGETRPPAGQFAALALGEKRSCGLRPDGSAICWGSRAGPARPGPYTAIAVETHLDGSDPARVCALRADKTIDCWSYR